MTGKEDGGAPGHGLRVCRQGRLQRGTPKEARVFKDLASRHPELLAEWDWERNGDLKPTDVQAISRKLVWWRGECGHVYQMAVRDRVRAKPGYCPYCSGRKRPERPIRLN